MPQHKQDQQVQSKQSGSVIYNINFFKWPWIKAKYRHKEGQGSGIDFTRILPADVTKNILNHHLPNSDVLSMHQTSKKFKGLFQPRVDVLKPLKCVVEGNIDALITLIQDNPGLLFKKGEVKAPRGQIYYNVSPYMLMKFLCDRDMIARVMRLIPERFNPIREAQDAELGHGGADLVKLDFDPMSVTSDDFNKICAFKTHINVQGTPTSITFPLLENPDGLLYWKDAQGAVNFYYANRDTQTVIPIIPVATTPEEHKALELFENSFDEMENNSARRSTNKEYQLIAKLIQRTLHRQGIYYSDAHGVRYCDSHTPFQLINRYRTSIRLYEEAANNRQWERAHQYWQEGVGMAQGEEMWLLQRICEDNRPFYPLPEHFDEFKRGFVFYSYITDQHELAFNNGQLTKCLGLDLALFKDTQTETDGACGRRSQRKRRLNLTAICRLVEDAKIKTMEHALESDLGVQPTFELQR